MLQPSDRNIIEELTTLCKRGVEWGNIPAELSEEYARILVDEAGERTHLAEEVRTALSRLHRAEADPFQAVRQRECTCGDKSIMRTLHGYDCPYRTGVPS